MLNQSADKWLWCMFCKAYRRFYKKDNEYYCTKCDHLRVGQVPE